MVNKMNELQWSDDYLSLEFLEKTEQVTVEETWQTFGGNGYISMRNLINLFSRMSYFLNHEVAQEDSDDHWFQVVKSCASFPPRS